VTWRELCHLPRRASVETPVLTRKIARRASCLALGVAHLPRLAALLVVAAAAACGGKSFEANDQDPTAGTGNDAGTGSGGTGSVAGTSNKGGSSSAGTGQGGVAGAVCDSFDDQPGHYINVAIINKTNAAIHLGDEMLTCGTSPLFAVSDARGGMLTRPGACRAPCQSARDNEPSGGCVALCAQPTAITLQSGDVLYTTWDGLYEIQTELPKQCISPGSPQQCSQALQIAPGTFTFSAQAGSSLNCAQTADGMCGTCIPSGNGGCTTSGGLISGPMHEATATVALNASYGVFGPPQPAPAPANPGSDAPSGAMAFLTVELVFTN
jgi:hypothetical protein